MKNFKPVFFLLLLMFIFSSAYSAPSKKKYSILGESKDEVYEQFNEYDNFENIKAYDSIESFASTNFSYEAYRASLPISVQEVAGQEILDYLNNNILSRKGYSADKWQKKEELAKEQEESKAKPAGSQQALPPGIKANLPFESELSISGRKLIGFDYTSRIYDKEESGKRKGNSDFKMQQELQMRIYGRVGDRLNINVDYDDTTDKKDISLIYKGQPDEFVQEAAFGDISVSLPSTEFVSYSKELFGLKVDTRHKNFGASAFFSKTKGTSESKRFTGNTQLERKTIPDTAYIKHKYYTLRTASETRQIKSGTAKVYIDYQKLDPKYNISIDSTTPLNYLKDPMAPAYAGNFILLVAGQDYTIDYNTGILTFKNTLTSNYVVAVDYQFTDNTWLSSSFPFSGLPAVIKDSNNTEQLSMENKTFYNLGNLQINHDNGRGNFILELKDLNGDVPTTIEGGKTVPKYPTHLIVDYENGVFNINVNNSTSPLHDSLYTLNTHLYNFVTEYQYNAKILSLRPGIVPQSEKVVVDGHTLARGVDYIMDYDLGILTILSDSIIKETSTIDVSYDYSLFGSESESTLVGSRISYDITNNISLGASVLYDFTAKGGTLPDIRNTPTSLLVAEVDTKIADLDIEALNMRIDAEAEYAFSTKDDNTTGKALIDSMDSSLDETFASMVDDNWFHSATGFPTVDRYLNDLHWTTREIAIKDIDPDLEIISGQKQIVLDVDYDVRSRSEIAFSQILSVAGYDFSKKLYIDVWIQDNGSTADFIVEYAASISEKTDTAVRTSLYTEDKDGNGIISPWEDTGQEWHNPDTSISLIGANNGKLDTEDLNGNGALDTSEEVVVSASLNSGTVIKNVNGWKQIRIPLTISDPANWKNVRILRFKIARVGGESGRISIGKIAITGNKWEKTNSSQGYEVSAIGQSDFKYVSLLTNQYYRDLYDIDGTVRKDEQSLKIEYDNVAGYGQAYAKSVYTGSSLDLSKYESIRFFVYAGNAVTGDEIIFRAGGSDDNYFEYKITIDTQSWQGWRLITINQTGSGRSKEWSSPDPNATVTVTGDPSLEKIAQFTLGVNPLNSDTSTREVWFNEIHVKGSKTLDGAAWKAAGTLNWLGTDRVGGISVNASRKAIDRNFQTITAGVYDRDYLEDAISIQFEGIKADSIVVAPIKAGLSRTRTITPDVTDNTSNIVSINDEGKVVSYSGYAETNLNLGVDLPQVAAQYTRTISDTSQLERIEDKEVVSGNLIYNNPVQFPILPTSVQSNVRFSNSYFKVYPDQPVTNSDDFLGLNAINEYLSLSEYHTYEQGRMFSVKLPFKFSKGITFTPSYLKDKVREKNNDFIEEIEYGKSLNQTIGASLVVGIVKWFSPVFTYNINTRENYNVNKSTDPANLIIPGEKKYITRTGSGEVLWNVSAYDIAATPYLKTLTFSSFYRLQDSDSYDNVDKNFESTGFSMDKIWIRDNPLLEVLPSYSTMSYTVRTILNRDDIRFTGRYMPLEAFDLKGMFSPLNTLSTNFTYTEGSEYSYITGTTKDVYTRTWPDLLIGISKFERFFGEVKWMTDTQLNFKYRDKTITTHGVSHIDSTMIGFDYRCKVLKKLDLYVSLENTKTNEDDYNTPTLLSDGLSRKWIGQGGYDLGKWRFSIRYENEENWSKNATGVYSSKVQKHSYYGQINSDLSFPSGIKIPIINANIPLKNRVVFLSNIKYIIQESVVNIETDNNINYGITANADYEISKYFRFLLGLSWDRYEYKYNSDYNYSDITIASKLTIQF